MTTDEHAASHKERVADSFSRIAASYDAPGPRNFTRFGRRLVAYAGMLAGASVLDVGVGRGAVLFPLAEQVGPAGHVTGIDLASGMLAETDAEARRQGLTNVTLRRMDAEHLEFTEATFDAVFAGFSLMFLPNLGRALTEFRRVLRPGGRLVASTWADPDPRFGWYVELLRPYTSSALALGTPLNQAEPLQGAFATAGLVDIEVITETHDAVYADAATWWAWQWAHLNREALERMPAEQLQRVEAAAATHLPEQTEADGIHQLASALLGRGVRPTR